MTERGEVYDQRSLICRPGGFIRASVISKMDNPAEGFRVGACEGCKAWKDLPKGEKLTQKLLNNVVISCFRTRKFLIFEVDQKKF